MSNFARFLVLAAGVACLSEVVLQVTISWARRHLLDVPNLRSLHKLPTPRGGGFAIVAGTLTGWVLFLWLSGDPPGRPVAGVLLAALLTALVSGIDDLRSLSARIRMAVHLAAALITTATAGYFVTATLPGLGTLELAWLGAALTLCWIVGLTNAFNFMDGIDGLAGTQALIAGTGWGLIACLSGESVTGSLSLSLGVSSAVFLSRNWSPARIFMGDIGSAFLGYLLAAIPILGLHSLPDAERLPGTATLMVWPFLFDSGYTFAARLKRGENVFEAHRSHLYQRLVQAGLSHARVSRLYGALGLLSCALALLWQLYPRVGTWVGPLGAAGVALLLLAWVRAVERPPT